MGRSVPDKLLRERDVPRTVSLVFLAALTALAAALNAVSRIELLGPAAFLSGLAFGGFQGASFRHSFFEK